jgi:hypothetical protein
VKRKRIEVFHRYSLDHREKQNRLLEFLAKDEENIFDRYIAFVIV